MRFTGIGQLPTLPDTPHTVGANIGGNPASGPRFVATNTLTVNEALLAAGDIFTQDLILTMVLIAHTNTFPIKPISLRGMQINGVLILHPLQVRSLKRNFSTGQWGDIQKAAMTGGQVSGNPIFVGSIGMYEGVVIHEDAQIPYGDGTGAASRNALAAVGTTPFVARGVFCGAQAACMSMGRAQGNANRMKWVEELLDANNQLRVTSGKIYGIKKNVFNSQDFATITVSTYEVQ